MILLSPVVPSTGGTGLAMRAGVALEALSRKDTVHVLVVPVVGELEDAAWARSRAKSLTVVRPLSAQAAAEGLMDLMADRRWRARLAASEPLPELARRASPAMASGVLATTPLPRGEPIHVVRSYLAPLGLALAERLGAPWTTLDLDDDDEALLHELGEDAEAAAYARLVTTFGPAYAWCALASLEEARALSTRTGLRCHALPNAVALPRLARSGADSADDSISILFVGNLTYVPNVEAARRLVRSVLPALRKLTDRPVRATLVGRFAPDGDVEALGGKSGVTLTGYVANLDGYYSAASVAVVPLSSGAGTRIKLLEAFAHRVPVVCSSAASAGLAVTHERHLLVADSAREQARAVLRLTDDGELRSSLIEAAGSLVAAEHTIDVVGRRLRELMPAG